MTQQDQDHILNRRLRDRYDALSDVRPHRCWSPFGLAEPGILVKTNPHFMTPRLQKSLANAILTYDYRTKK